MLAAASGSTCVPVRGRAHTARRGRGGVGDGGVSTPGAVGTDGPSRGRSASRASPDGHQRHQQRSTITAARTLLDTSLERCATSPMAASPHIATTQHALVERHPRAGSWRHRPRSSRVRREMSRHYACPMLAALLADVFHTEDRLRSLGSLATLVVFAIVFAESGLMIGFFLPGDSLLFTAGLLSGSVLPPLPILIVGSRSPPSPATRWATASASGSARRC